MFTAFGLSNFFLYHTELNVNPFIKNFYKEESALFIYPNDLKAKAKLWLWELRDLAILGVGLLLSVLALSQGLGMIPLVVTVLYGILSIRMEGACVLDFIRYAAAFLFGQQYFEWRDIQ